MTDLDVFPSFGRLSAATRAAALSVALSAAALAQSFAPIVFLFALIIAAAHAALIGLPAYLMLQRHWALNYPVAALAGILIGAIPVGIFVLGMATGGGPDFDALIVSPIFGGFGAVGGLVFRAVLGRDPQNQ